MDSEQILSFNVGIAPEAPVVLHDVRPERKRKLMLDPSTMQASGATAETNDRPVSHDGNPPKLALIGGGFDANNIPALVGINGEALNPLTWVEYAAWRRSKCRPFNHKSMPRYAVTVPASDPECLDGNRARALEEIDQGTHELVGEVGELGELILEHGPGVFYGDLRTKLIDECGDIFFCALWALDAWGNNPFDDAKIDDLELLRVDDDRNPLAVFAAILADQPATVTLVSRNFVHDLLSIVTPLLASAMTGICLTSNSFKKLRFQRREQSVDTQVERIASALFAVNQILIIANSNVEEALISNQRKLNARFPDGYKPGVGGGIRTGEGR